MGVIHLQLGARHLTLDDLCVGVGHLTMEDLRVTVGHLPLEDLCVAVGHLPMEAYVLELDNSNQKVVIVVRQPSIDGYHSLELDNSH